MRVALLWAVLLVPALAAPTAKPEAGEVFLRRVETVLKSDPEFFAWHRGYLAYLDARPDLLSAERAWWDVAIEPSMGASIEVFDEALLGDSTATAGLNAFYDLLARDPALRAETEALQRVEFTERDRRAVVTPALQALRADPDLALRLFQGDMDLGDLAEPIQAFAVMLQQRPGLVKELGDAFGALGAAPLVQTRLLPWWQSLAQKNTVASAYAGLAARFAEAPRRFWAWHARELAWAEDAQARDWARYLYRRARRLPTMGEAYVHYLRGIYARDGARSAAEARYEQAVGDVAVFPPLPAPPVLAPKTLPPTEGDNTALTPRAPGRPERPKPPTPPRMPERPTLEMRKAAPRRAAPDPAAKPGLGYRSEERK